MATEIQQDYIQRIRSRILRMYDIVPIPMASAQTNIRINTGNFNTLIFTVVPDVLYVRLGLKENPPITIASPSKIWQKDPFIEIYITHPAYPLITDNAELILGSDLDLSEIAEITPKLLTAISTSTALGVVTSWTSDSLLVSDYKEFVFLCVSDVSGYIYVQFSNDNLNWDSSFSFPIDANLTNQGCTVDIKGKYVRVVFEKDATSQTIFRFSSIARR